MVLSSLDKKIHVLLVDDDEEDYLIIRRLCAIMSETDCDLEWVSSSEEAIAVIQQQRHDVYLIDYRLDARTGLDVLEEVHAIERNEPFILLTGVGDQGVERESLKLAASDYVVKRNLTSDGLSRTINYALGRKEQEQQKIDQLIELNKTKDEFISIASHQLRTPATTVKQYVAMVMDGLAGNIPDSQRALLQKAYDSNERQLTIINDLLKVAQIDAGRMQLTFTSVDLSSLIDSIVNDFCPLYESADQSLESDIAADITVRTDENALRMVVDNLLENALKYSEKGSRTRLIVKRQAATVSIVVEDQGVGVTDPARLFQKFSRISNKLSTEVGGTGLGLYWAHSVTQLLGGLLRYQQNEPTGSRFIVEITDL